MNKDFKLVEVNDSVTEESFIKLPNNLYKNNKNYVHPLESDIKNIFDKNKNKFFKHGECIRWILKDSENKTVGRVAAFIDFQTLESYEQPTGGMGFFECINNQNAAFVLFDKCKEWLQEKGMEAMDGPINFGSRMQWWGLHVDGDLSPVYGMFYHHKYYKIFFENYGFKDFFQQYNYEVELDIKNLHKIVLLKAQRVYRDEKYTTEFFDKKNTGKYIKDFVTIYNNTWIGDIPGVNKMTEEEVADIFKQMKPLLEENYLIFAYYDKKPIGFFIMMPDINEILIHLKGKLNFKAKLIFLWYKYFKKNKTMIGQIFGIDTNFQNKGIESILIEKFSQIIGRGKEPYSKLQFNWIGDFNPRMMHLMEQYLSAKIKKTYITYRYLFDRNKEFKRAEPTK